MHKNTEHTVHVGVGWKLVEGILQYTADMVGSVTIFVICWQDCESPFAYVLLETHVVFFLKSQFRYSRGCSR